jgi:hypothetical protein
MKLFISFSSETSHQIAQKVHKWLPLILPAVKPFITSADIDKGASWAGEISRELEQSNYGIICLTPDNLQSQWLAFEAGALSKLKGRAATVLFGLNPEQVPYPLKMFQGTRFHKADVRQLVGNLNEAVAAEERRENEQLDTLFEMLWPSLEQSINVVLQTPQTVPATPDPNQVIAEMMAMLRQQNAVLASPEKLLQPILNALDQRLAALVAGRDALWSNWATGRGNPALFTQLLRLQSDTPLPLRASSAEPERTVMATCQCDDKEHDKHAGTSCPDPATRDGLCNDCYEHRAAKLWDSMRPLGPSGGPQPRR